MPVINTNRKAANKAVLHNRLPATSRAAEVELLIGDPAKAKKQLDWEPKVKFKELVAIMVDADLKLAENEAKIKATLAD
jgi:GDP-D-mannose dehydratase